MYDLFAAEEALLQKHKHFLESVPAGGVCPRETLEEMVKGYARILRQLRTLTKLSDKTAVNLNSDKLELMEKIQYDALTSIYNRRYMDERLKQIFQSVECAEVSFCFMMADVDYFKNYNDRYGHLMGDECLKLVAGALSHCLKDSEGFVARYGGEEFAVVIPHLEQADAAVLGEKLLHAVVDKKIMHEQNAASPYVSISIGVVTGIIRRGSQETDYIQAADCALYQSKRSGRNKVTHINLEEK